MDINTPEFGRVGEDYRRHRAGFPDSFYDRLEAIGLGLEGRFILATAMDSLWISTAVPLA